VQITKDAVVTIEYTARLEDGRIVDSTEQCGPVTYLHGNEQIFPALEQAVEGLEAGAERTLRLAASASYGERREDLVRRLPRACLPPDLTPACGERYSLRSPDGQRLVFRVLAVEGEDLVADFNNPAAGLALEIHARVVAVRRATESELRRGTLR